jgi:hypothetical protein
VDFQSLQMVAMRRGVSFASYAMKFGKIFGEAKQQLELK